LTDPTRTISDRFITELKQGRLEAVLHRVHNDATLDLEIRKDAIVLCYRGADLIKIRELGRCEYEFHFDREYVGGRPIPLIPPADVHRASEVETWMRALPSLKDLVDMALGDRQYNVREYVQQIVHANNGWVGARATDFFIADVDHTCNNGPAAAHFDMLGLRWHSDRPSRADGSNAHLVLMDVKDNRSPLKGTDGLRDHFKQIETLLEQEGSLAQLRASAEQVFNQKLELGLIDSENSAHVPEDDEPEYLLMLVDHDPESRQLIDLLEGRDGGEPIMTPRGTHMTFATASFVGFGLYKEGILTTPEILSHESRKLFIKDAD